MEEPMLPFPLVSASVYFVIPQHTHLVIRLYERQKTCEYEVTTYTLLFV